MHRPLTIRSATEYPQELERIAKILHGTDPFIFSFWRETADALAELLVSYMRQRGFVFGQNNIYIAREDGATVGLISAATRHSLCRSAQSTDAFDLTELSQVDQRTKVICNQYLGRIYKSVLAYPDDVAYIAALCIDPRYRRRRIATRLLKNCIYRLQQDGIKTICLDCLETNVAARNLYESLGFELVNTGIGFDGAGNCNNPQVRTCSYALCGL